MKKIIGIALGCLLLSSCYSLRYGTVRGDKGVYTSREERKKEIEKIREERRKEAEQERERRRKAKQQAAEEYRKEIERRRW